MSHLTTLKTSFQNLTYLEQALEKLVIGSELKTEKYLYKNQIQYVKKLIIPQSNGHNIEFAWNGNEYDLIFDISFWDQSCPVDVYIDKITQQYITQAIITEGRKKGFSSTRYEKNLDGSKILALQHWKEKN